MQIIISLNDELMVTNGLTPFKDFKLFLIINSSLEISIIKLNFCIRTFGEFA